MDNNTIRVLSLSGGGARGYLSAVFLDLVFRTINIPIYQLFDVICGASAGGIGALALADGKPIDEIKDFYTVHAPWIFTIRSATDVGIDASVPSNRPSLAQKLYFLSQDDEAFYKSVSVNSNYGNARLKSVINSQFGTRTLQDLKTNVLITSMNDTTKKFIMNSNVIDANFSNQSSLISDVALATSAAPIYLPPHVVNQEELIDGGVYQNSPARLGLSLGRRLKPLAKRACVMSIGTGLGDYGFDYELAATLANPARASAFYEEFNTLFQVNSATTLSLPFENSIKKIFSLFDKASAGAEESVHKGFSLEAEPIGLTNLYYYRFQVQLEKERETELDNTTPEIFEYYKNTAQNKYAQDSEKIATFLSHLLA